MRHGRLLAALTGAALVSTMTPAPASAAVVYTFTSYTTYQFGPTPGTFSYTAPGFITSNVIVPVPNCTVNGPPGVSCGATQNFYPDASGLSGFDTDAIGFHLDDLIHLFYFPDNAFSAYGTYPSFVLDDQSGLLVVKPVPEPSTWALLLAGFAALGWAARRRTKPKVRLA